MTIWVVACLAIAALSYVAVTFNELVAARNRVRTAWADIDVQLQRRHDLVPPLVAVVKGYAAHEQTTFEAVAALRNRAQGEAMPAERGRIESDLGERVGGLLALGERYPDLKASANFLQLQRDLIDVEDRLQQARSAYNDVVRDFNTRIENFPDVLLARPFGFRSAEPFQAQSRDAVRV